MRNMNYLVGLMYGTGGHSDCMKAKLTDAEVINSNFERVDKTITASEPTASPTSIRRTAW